MEDILRENKFNVVDETVGPTGVKGRDSRLLFLNGISGVI